MRRMSSFLEIKSEVFSLPLRALHELAPTRNSSETGQLVAYIFLCSSVFSFGYFSLAEKSSPSSGWNGPRGMPVVGFP